MEISSEHKLPASGTFENYWTPYWLREGDSHPHRWDEALEIVNGMDVFLDDVDIPWGSMVFGGIFWNLRRTVLLLVRTGGGTKNSKSCPTPHLGISCNFLMVSDSLVIFPLA